MGGFWMSDLAPCDEDIRNQVLRGTHMIFTRGTSERGGGGGGC